VSSSHERYDGPERVVSGVREGWGFRCECGYRSPLFQAHTEALEAMHAHRTAPPESVKPGLFSRKKKWPGWPNERRYRPFT
jgi:hypothetical protein